MKPVNIELHIEELILQGLESGDHDRIGRALQAELTRLFTERGVPSSLGNAAEIAYLDGGSFEVAQGSSADSIGVQVAQGVYGGLGR